MLWAAGLIAAGLDPTRFQPASKQTSSGKACIPSNTHGWGRNDFVRTRLIGEDEMRIKASNAFDHNAIPAGVEA